MQSEQPNGNEQEALRKYVGQKLRAGVSPVHLQNELVRYHVSDSQAQALIHDVYEELLTGARGFKLEAPPSESPKDTLAAMSHEELVDYLGMQFASGYDVRVITQQMLDYGYSQEEAANLLAEADIAVEPAPASPRQALPSTWQGKGEIRSLYERVPLSPSNESGWLNMEQRGQLLRGIGRTLSMLAVLLVVGFICSWYLVRIIVENSYSTADMVGLTAFFVRWGWLLATVAILAVLGSLFLIFDLLMHLLDLFPGRVRAVRTFLRWPAHLAVEDQTVHTVSMAGRRRRYRLWNQDLYLELGRWGMEWPYLVYYSPLTRWIWHIEPEVQDEPDRGGILPTLGDREHRAVSNVVHKTGEDIQGRRY